MHLSKVIVHGFKAASDQPLDCQIPGRFCVLAGPNSAGKSTVVESILLSHRDVFPYTGRPTAATLSRTVSSRSIEIEYELESNDQSPLGKMFESDGRLPHHRRMPLLHHTELHQHDDPLPTRDDQVATH